MKCPQCQKNEARIDPTYGVVCCEECSLKNSDNGKKYVGMTEKKREYYATPFWRVMGLKAKPEEKAMEKEMKRRGLTYLDLQRMRQKNAQFNSSKLVDKLERGELRDEPDPVYHRK